MSDSVVPKEPAPPEKSSSFRTYARDVAFLTGKPLPKNVAYEVPPPPPRPTPPPAQIIPKAPSTNETRESVLKRFEAPIVPPAAPAQRTPTLHTTPAPSLPQTPPKDPPGIPPLKKSAPIHTYTSDFREHAASAGISRIGMVAAEQDTESRAPIVFKEKKQGAVMLAVSGIILVVAGIGSVYAAYRFATGEPPLPEEAFVPTLVFPDRRIQISGSGEELRQGLLGAAGEALADPGVAVVYMVYSTTTEGGIVEKIATGKEIFTALRLSAPDILLRNIEPESTLGVVRVGGQSHPFFVLRVSSYERTYAGMLEWEASIERDLFMFYPPHQKDAASGTATSSREDLAAPFRLSFVDEVIDNRDVRMLRDGENKTIMVYGYYDKKTLIIARSEEMFSLLLERLSSTRAN